MLSQGHMAVITPTKLAPDLGILVTCGVGMMSLSHGKG
jgi:hypothetical protein